jgi:hypothetical protein
MNANLKVESNLGRAPVIIPVDAYVSAEYTGADQKHVWLKVGPCVGARSGRAS